MASVKKGIELDTRLENLIVEVFNEYQIYLPTLQDKKAYERKVTEYVEIIKRKAKEGILSNGKSGDDTDASNAAE